MGSLTACSGHFADGSWSRPEHAEHVMAFSHPGTSIASDVPNKASLMALPTELRVQIFGCVEDSDITRSVHIAQNCTLRLEANGCPTLAALSRACRQIHEEVDDRLYRYRKFNVDVLGADSLLQLWRRNFDEDLLFLNRMRKVHFAITINTAKTKFQRLFEMIERALSRLMDSAELQEFTFEVREIYHLAGHFSYVNSKLGALRMDVASQALEAGKSEKDRELDIAWAVLEFLKTGFR